MVRWCLVLRSARPGRTDTMVAMPSPRSDAPEPGLEPGDRFEVLAAGAVDGLRLPAALGPGGFAIERLEDDAGRPLEMAIDPTGRRLSVEPPGRWLADPFAAIWLEYQAPGRFRLVVEPGPSGPADGVLTTEQGVRIEPDAGGSGGGPGGAGAGGRAQGIRPGAPGRPAGDACRVRPADRAAHGARHGPPGAPDPHRDDRAAGASAGGPCSATRWAWARRSRPG